MLQGETKKEEKLEGKSSSEAKRKHLIKKWLFLVMQMPLRNDPSSSNYNASPRLKLSEPCGSTAEVLLHGGQIISWKNELGEELLFMSSKEIWNSSKTIRGGVSICFPQFGNVGSLFHRSPRNRLWSIDISGNLSTTPSNGCSSVDLIFQPATEGIKVWPRRFELRLHISLSKGKLTLVPSVKNIDDKSFAFTFSLSNYLSISDISEVRVEGLETLDYFDNLLQRKRFTEQADAVTFEGEMDRAYLNTPSSIAVIDHERKRTFVLHKAGLPDAVVWNPWDKMGKALPDLGDDDYKKMLYLCSASVETPIILKPTEEWRGLQEISVVSSSYCSGQLNTQIVQHCLNSFKKPKQ